MRYFSILTIKEAIEGLQEIRGNWLVPAFVFAANDVNSASLTDMGKRHGTDTFLDRYFSGARLGLEPFPNGTNLLRPRMKDATLWKPGKKFEGDFIVRQATKLWANLLSSRGYREMAQRGYIQMENNLVALEPSFKAQFESQVPATFHFEDLMVWLYAFEGVPDGVSGWQDLFDNLIQHDLGLTQFRGDYQGRFRLSTPAVQWPDLLDSRPSDEEFLNELAPALVAFLQNNAGSGGVGPEELEDLPADDAGLSIVRTAISNGDSYSFLLAGPPGTGKTRYARQLEAALTEKNPSQALFLQFHPTLGYDDFVEGFRPVETKDGKGVIYRLEQRLLLSFCKTASDNPGSLHVLVIDEINRGDIARIFGELLTYLEPDYRGVSFNLSISGKPISLPPNLIVIATANPYDRSVTDLDDALLRRFWVIEMEPSAAILQAHLETAGVDPALIRRTLHLFGILNRVFPSGFGHATFLRVRNVEDLHAIWVGRVRLALRRTLLHDPITREDTIREIEALLDIPEAEADGELASEQAAEASDGDEAA